MNASRYLNAEGLKEIRLVDWDGSPLFNEEDIADTEQVQIAAVYADGTQHYMEDVPYSQAFGRLAELIKEMERG